MEYKIVGVCLLLLAGGYMAVHLVRKEKKRLRAVDGYISLLFYIKGQIDCYAKPISDILLGADPELIADCIGKGGKDRICVDYSEFPALVAESGELLEPECKRILHTFSGELGGVYRDEQIRRCDYYIEALTRERERLFEALPARMRINSVLSVSSALMLAVLLW